jgi:hypothetical protein
MEKLRSALESDSINEESKKYVLNAAIYINAKLSNDDADQQGSGNTAQDKAADFDFPTRYASAMVAKSASNGSIVNM